MMTCRFIIIGFLLLVAPLVAQEIEEYPVNDFSGGLVNSISNSLMKDNQAIVLDNFDIDGYGALKRRQGFRQCYIAQSGDPPHSHFVKQSIYAYYNHVVGKQLLIIGNDTLRYLDSLTKMNIASLIVCDDDDQTCTTFVGEGFYLGRKHLSFPYSEASAIVNENLILGGTASEIVFYDGDNQHAGRPYASGQPQAYPIDGAGTITGSVRYRYIFSNTNCPDASVPSFEISVTNAKILVEGLLASLVGDSTYVYREDNASGDYCLVAKLYGDTSFIDSVSMDSNKQTDTLSDVKFPYKNCGSIDYDSCAPGGMLVEILSTKRAPVCCLNPQAGIQQCHYPWGIQMLKHGFGLDTCTSVNSVVGDWWVAYTVVMVDSAGRYTYMSPPTIKKLGYGGASNELDTLMFYSSITNIPVPLARDSLSIVNKILLRMHIDPNYRFADTAGLNMGDHNFIKGFTYIENRIGKFFQVTELDPYATTYTDSVPFDFYAGTHYANKYLEYCSVDMKLKKDSAGCNWDSTGCCPYSEYHYRYYYEFDYDTTTIGAILGYCDDDSAIEFQPQTITLHQSRLFSVGNPWLRNGLYFSGFGKPTNWHRDKFINIPSQRGDWFNGLLSMGDWLLAFRQNSFVGFSGQSFYQYQIKELSADIGLTAPRSLAGGYNRAFWAHNTGVYSFPGDNWDNPISWTIKNSLDSIGDNLMSAWGGVVGDEYWLSGAIPRPIPGAGEYPPGDSINSKIYIYSFVPFPHWRCYTFGIIDGVPYDYESDAADYRTTRWVFIADNDTLYDWNYADASLDGSDSIFAIYQSKSFFDNGNNREQVFYVDLQGTGSCDMLSLTFFDLKGQDSIKTVSQAVDFTKKEIQRFVVKEIVKDFSVRIADHGAGDYTITGYTIGYLPSDRGRIR